MVSIWNFSKTNLQPYGVSQNYALTLTLTFEWLRVVERDFRNVVKSTVMFDIIGVLLPPLSRG